MQNPCNLLFRTKYWRKIKKGKNYAIFNGVTGVDPEWFLSLNNSSYICVDLDDFMCLWHLVLSNIFM